MVAPFAERLQGINPDFAAFEGLRTVQVNLGDLCNLRCTHCHVNASQRGMRVMGREVMAAITRLLSRRPGLTLDITGGCPEMNPDFRFLVEETAGLAGRRQRERTSGHACRGCAG